MPASTAIYLNISVIFEVHESGTIYVFAVAKGLLMFTLPCIELENRSPTWNDYKDHP
jgi:hypothetical protein